LLVGEQLGIDPMCVHPAQVSPRSGIATRVAYLELLIPASCNAIPAELLRS
jgi:hypothetical protein